MATRLRSTLRDPKDSDGRRREEQGNTNMLKGFAEAATDIVGRAASILEEEIAAGILAAKVMENRFINVNTVRTGKPEEVLLRFRRDVHEVLDIVIDLAIIATNAVGGLTRNVIKIRGETSNTADDAPSPSRAPLPALSPTSSARAGGTVEFFLSLENDSDAPTEEFAFHATDLVNPNGDRILAQQISCMPNSLVIAAHDRARLAISVVVPEGSATGVYAGLLQATNLAQLRAMLLVPVE